MNCSALFIVVGLDSAGSLKNNTFQEFMSKVRSTADNQPRRPFVNFLNATVEFFNAIRPLRLISYLRNQKRNRRLYSIFRSLFVILSIFVFAHESPFDSTFSTCLGQSVIFAQSLFQWRTLDNSLLHRIANAQ
jgi:hypothetical protein